jgi:hypothetical protein
VDNSKPEKIVTLTGPGGIGKTSLAAEALWRMTDGENTPGDFPDGVLFQSFYNEPKVELAFEHIGKTFGEEPSPNPALAAQRILEGRNTLLLLNGAEAADDLGALLLMKGNCCMLVTSRDRGDIREEWQDLDPLEVEEGVKLLQDWGGMRAKDNDAAWYSVDSLHAQASRTANEVALALRGKASNYALVTPEAARCA